MTELFEHGRDPLATVPGGGTLVMAGVLEQVTASMPAPGQP